MGRRSLTSGMMVSQRYMRARDPLTELKEALLHAPDADHPPATLCVALLSFFATKSTA